MAKKSVHPHHTRYARLVAAFAFLAFTFMTTVSMQHAAVKAQIVDTQFHPAIIDYTR